MRRLLLTLPMLASACAISVSDAALCTATEASRRAHANALLVDGGDTSVITGADLLEKFKAGCGE